MLAKLILATALIVCAASQLVDAQTLKKIRIASKAPGESLVPYTISQRLGFYREEGFDVDVIVTRGTVTTQVVVSGAVDYGNGGSIPAILGGARMFGPPGYAYVYRSYGIHWCLNFVCEPEGEASAVLIRALAPTHGLAAMRRRRGVTDERLLCSGPGRLGEAPGISDAQYGLSLYKRPFEIFAPADAVEIAVGPRIGLTKAIDHPWRYGLKGSRFVSKPFKR